MHIKEGALQIHMGNFSNFFMWKDNNNNNNNFLNFFLLGWANAIAVLPNNANQKDIFGALLTEMSSRNWKGGGGVGRWGGTQID